MSGKPNLDGVRDVRYSLQEYSALRQEIIDLKAKIAADSERLKLAETELRGLVALIDGRLEQMDVRAPGNHGWELRHFEFLLMMASQHN